jgi:hypothetical protein
MARDRLGRLSPAHVSLKQVERFLKALRETHPDFDFIFRHGACYQLYLMLKSLRPDAELWYQHNPGHVWTKIDGAWFDIRGKRTRKPSKAERITAKRLGRPERWKRRLAMIIDWHTAAAYVLRDEKRKRKCRTLKKTYRSVRS